MPLPNNEPGLRGLHYLVYGSLTGAILVLFYAIITEAGNVPLFSVGLLATTAAAHMYYYLTQRRKS